MRSSASNQTFKTETGDLPEQLTRLGTRPKAADGFRQASKDPAESFEPVHRNSWRAETATLAKVERSQELARDISPENLSEVCIHIADSRREVFAGSSLAFYCRRFEAVRKTFALTPDYLRTEQPSEVRNLMDTGASLGRRFRALKLWMVLRYFGTDGIEARIADHIRLARLFASWVDDDPDFERLAPVSLSVVCFRASPSGASTDADTLDRLNADLLASVNQSGEVFLSSTRLHGRLALRLAVGHIRTTESHVSRAWQIIRTGLASQRTMFPSAAPDRVP